MPSYLIDLTLRMAAGAAQLADAVRKRHVAYLAESQNADGGFSARQGPSDLYYTSFALRSLAILGELNEERAMLAARFLRERIPQALPSIDFLSLVTSAVLVEMATGVDPFAQLGRDRRQSLIAFVEPFRRPDGGYAKTHRAGRGSTYHTFLVAATKQMVGAPLDGAAAMAALVRSRQRDDGGFVEIDPMRFSGTNPTAAALGLLLLTDQLDATTHASAARFLARMQTADGGLRANTQIPVADLLSTFTGLVALTSPGGDRAADTAISPSAARRFAESLETPTGGFLAGCFDDTVDVEYTFYGLGTLALLESWPQGPARRD